MVNKTQKLDIKGYFDQDYFNEKYGSSYNFNDHFEKNFQEWSYDLCLGDEVYITSEEEPYILSEAEPFVTIKPGDFALLITFERLKLPKDIMAFISVKFGFKKQGLINISGFHVDPNYEGRIIFSVYNAGPHDILLKYKDAVFMIFFQELEGVVEKSKKPFDNIPTQMISEIKGQSVTLANNHQKIEKLEHSVKLYGGIAVAIIVALIGIIFSLFQK